MRLPTDNYSGLAMRSILKVIGIADYALMPFVYPAGAFLKLIRRGGLHRLPRCRAALMKVGVLPVTTHYYEPQIDNRTPEPDFSEDRNLPGLDLNVAGQLEFLDSLNFADELADLPLKKPKSRSFYLDNGWFVAGDAEYWYQMVRSVKPRRIFEVGSGHSTLMAHKALEKNRQDDPDYKCEHSCIEPYERPWLEELGISVTRRKVEELDLDHFAELEEGDILFIDSSHVIRPQGDVLFEYLEILPSLNRGVYVHIHDIFTPKNYLKRFLQDQVLLWNEQYLLEAFLTNNHDWEVVGALNYLRHNHQERLTEVAPFLSHESEPGSFYMKKLR